MMQDVRSEQPVMSRPPEALRLALDAIQDLKGNQLVVLDLRGLNDATDYFVIASGTSDAHVRGIAESVMKSSTGRATARIMSKGSTAAAGCFSIL